MRKLEEGSDPLRESITIATGKSPRGFYIGNRINKTTVWG